MLLMRDNYDSLTWNLVQYLQAPRCEVKAVRNLEPVRRNVHFGAVDYSGWHGDTAIAIRTAVIQCGRRGGEGTVSIPGEALR